MKNTDKVTLTIGQLKKLIKESKSRKKMLKEEQSLAVKVLNDALDWNIINNAEGGDEQSSWSEQRIIDWEYKDIWTSIEYQCKTKGYDFKQIKSDLLKELGEDGIYNFIKKKVIDSGYWRDKESSKVKPFIDILDPAMNQAHNYIEKLKADDDIPEELINDLSNIVDTLYDSLEKLDIKWL